MRNINAIFLKQLKETLKNKSVLIHFLMFPALTVIMETLITIENMPEHFFTKLFAVMFVGMAPLTCMSSIIAEEKEKDTLRALIMSNVNPAQYLIGVGGYVWLFCMADAVVFAVCGGYKGADFALFIAVMAVGILLSILVGAVIGTASRNQMTATSISVPMMLVFSILPMLSAFNENVEKIASVTYSQQLSVLINDIGVSSPKPESFIIIAANLVVAVVLFTVFFKKQGLE